MLIKWHELQIIIVVAGCLRPRINLHNYYETIVIALYTYISYISYIAYATCDIYLNDIISCCAQLSGNNTSPCGMLCYVNLSHVCPSLSVCLLPSLSVSLSVCPSVRQQSSHLSGQQIFKTWSRSYYSHWVACLNMPCFFYLWGSSDLA